MASERPQGRADADLGNVVAFPVRTRVVPEKLAVEEPVPEAKSSEEDLAPVIRLFGTAKLSEKGHRLTLPKTTEGLNAALARSLMSLILKDFSSFADSAVRKNVMEKLSQRISARRESLVRIHEADSLVHKPRIKQAKDDLLQDLIIALAEMDMFQESPIVSLNHNDRMAIDPIKGPIEDTRIHIMAFYKSIFEKNGGLISFNNFNGLNLFFRNQYWFAIKNAVKKSPEYRALHSLMGDQLETLFLDFPSLENLIAANKEPIVAAWCQYGSLGEFVLSVAKKKPEDAKMQGAKARVISRHEFLLRKVKSFAEIGFNRITPSKRKEFMDELQGEINYTKMFIQEDIFEVKDTSNVILLSARTDKLRNEAEIITKIEEMLRGQAEKDKQVFINAFTEIFKFVTQAQVKRTAFYKSIAKWSPEVLDDFSDWIFAIVQQATQVEDPLMTRETLRARITNILSPKVR